MALNRKIVAMTMLACLVLVVSGCLRQSTSSEDDRKRSNNTATTNVNTLENLVLRELYGQLALYNVTVDVSTSSVMWWVSEEGYSVLAPAYETLLIKKVVSNDSIGRLVNNIPDSIVKDIDFFQISSAADTLFREAGYDDNSVNNSGPQNNYKYYDFVKSYTNDVVFCSVTTLLDVFGATNSNDSMIEMNIGCITREKYEQALSEQKRFLEVLDLQNKDTAVSIRQKVGNFYSVNINGRRGGAYAILTDQLGKLEKIYSGQEYPNCEVVDQYEVPVEIVGKCWSGDKEIDRPSTN